MPRILPISFKSVKSCKNAAFEKQNVLRQKRSYVLFRGFQTWLKSGPGVFVVLGFMGCTLSNWAVKMGQVPHPEKQKPGTFISKVMASQPPLCLSVWKNLCCLICRQTELPLGKFKFVAATCTHGFYNLHSLQEAVFYGVLGVSSFISFRRIFNHSRFFHFLQEALHDKSESMNNERKK